MIKRMFRQNPPLLIQPDHNGFVFMVGTELQKFPQIDLERLQRFLSPCADWLRGPVA